MCSRGVAVNLAKGAPMKRRCRDYDRRSRWDWHEQILPEEGTSWKNKRREGKNEGEGTRGTHVG